MFMFTDLIVAFLVLSPIEPPVPRQVSEPLWDALKRVSLAIEIVGPHERWRSDFQAELRYVRYHWRELCDAPPQSDSFRFPPPAVAAHCCNLNIAYQEYIHSRFGMYRHHYDRYEIYFQETRQLCLIWKTVFKATDTDHSWVHRRYALQKLRELIGPEAYYEGWLPPAAPLWRFDRLEP